MADEPKITRELAGRSRQIGILFWKNGKLFQRNKAGTFAELFMAILFVFLLILIRFFVDSVANPADTTAQDSNPEIGILDNVTLLKDKYFIYYYPDNTFIRTTVLNAVADLFSANANFTPIVSGTNIDNAGKFNQTAVNSLYAFIKFPSTYTSSFPNHSTYTIQTQELERIQYRIDSQFYELKQFLYDDSPQALCQSNRYYFLYGSVFNPLKAALDAEIIESLTSKAINANDQIKTNRFHCPAYSFDIFRTRFSFFVTLLIQFAFVFTLIVNVGQIILEKSSKMKEYLKLLGIKWYIIWFTWFMRVLLPYMLLTLIIAGISKIPFRPRIDDPDNERKAVFKYTDFFVVFSALFIYSIQTSMFCILLGQIFSRPFVGKAVTLVVWVMTAFEGFETSPTGLKYLMAIFPNTGLLLVVQVAFQFERGGVTLNMSNLYTNIFNDSLNVGAVLAMMIFWTIIYIPIAWYIERIFPGEYGAPLPFYFPFLKSYWFPKNNAVGDVNFSEIEEKVHGFEKEPNLKCTVSIKNISKRFRIRFKEKTVVDNLSLNIFENQITGLLGHNGAGKTTTTFMLCGIYAPDEGNAYILGSDIRYQMDRIRTSIGFCPQHDILYDDLTVAEHIDLVASIKGYKKEEIKQEIIEITTLVGLQNDLQKKSKQLSGGMKRRLSVAMAITGGSKIIILDEPTSGLDPFNRRGLWELIRKFKKDRSIILTTHFMEEADALSDRIAIMNHGQVKCSGSPLYLKNTFGSGYRIVLAKNNSFSESEFKSLLKSTISDISVESAIETNIAAEMTVSIPFNLSDKLPNLLSSIDNKKESLGIDGYGISSPTIEEVFIKIGSIDKNNEETANEYDRNDDGLQGLEKNNQLSNAFSDDFQRNTGIKLILQQIQALFLKRMFIFGRRVVLTIFILSFPFVAETVLAAILPSEGNLINTLRGIVTNFGNNNLNLGQYGTQQIPYYVANDDSTLTNILNTYHIGQISGASFKKFTSDSINDFVLGQRQTNLTAFLYDYFVGFNFENRSGSLFSRVHYSTLAFHSSAAVLSKVSNIILQLINGDDSMSITTVNLPVASTNTLSNSSNFLEILACLDTLPVSLLNFFNSIIIAFIISAMVMAVTRERTNGSKQLQLLSGVHYWIYWISNYLFDLCVCLFQISSIVISLKIVDAIRNDTSLETSAIAGDETLGYFFVLLIFSAFTWCTLAYIWSFLFKQDIIGFIVLLVILAVIAFIDMILTFLEIIFQSSDGGPDNVGANFIIAIRWILTILLPNLTIKRGMYNLKVRKNAFCINGINTILYTDYRYNEDPFSTKEPGIGLLLIISVVQFIMGNFILWILEAKPYARFISRKEKIDQNILMDDKIEEDVKEEIDRISSSDLKTQSELEPLLVNGLVKQFVKGKKKFLAVNNLSFGIKSKECFGLLGLNGAGKTTTFKILTGELNATNGEAYINGYDIVQNRSKARRSLGFCPQFDYLPEYLTVQESFELFSGIRGLNKQDIPGIVSDMIKVFKLNEMTLKTVQSLSGGNKRKVSAAIGFIGRPSVVILDEPTTGMDPAARRYLWTVIKRARDLGMTIVLTTHSMEESEALSTKLGIMVNGQFKCYGSVQHLKNKFGKGYSLILKCKHNDNLESSIKKIEDFVKNKIYYSKLTDKQEETLFYMISFDEDFKIHGTQKNEMQSIAELFKLIENNKDDLLLETYSLSQTSLEQVFLGFAKEQRNEIDKK